MKEMSIRAALCSVAVAAMSSLLAACGGKPAESSQPDADRVDDRPAPVEKYPIDTTPVRTMTPTVPVTETSGKSDPYADGYEDGYDDGYDDGRSGNGYGDSYDDDGSVYGTGARLYSRGYEEGYEDGFAEGEDDYDTYGSDR